ncbi:MAG: hypothetical protein RL469_1818 [Pseudomonadota bacterium]|jgi:CRP/FNR family cyclic AMP-dependent transcriptional regulator|nr:transcriptional regulator Crp [Gammaproteobacteria bacterium]
MRAVPPEAPRGARGTAAATCPAVAKFLAAAQRRSVAPRTVLVARSTPPRVGYVVDGSLEVMLQSPDGRELVLALLGRGEFFGELALFDPDAPRAASVRARGRAEVAEMSYERYANLAAHDPTLNLTLATQLAKRLSVANQKMRSLAFMNVAGRIAQALQGLCLRNEAMRHPQGVQLRVSRNDLGRMAGCSREMAGRAVKDLEAAGLIRAHGMTLIVYDPARLG